MRVTAPVDLLLTLERESGAGEGLTRQLYARIRAAILEGRLRAGDRLPPTRTLAHELGVARLTVATAYEWLLAEGYVRGRVGAGTFVAPLLDAGLLGRAEAAASGRDQTRVGLADEATKVTAAAAPAADARPPRLSGWGNLVARLPLTGAGSSPPAPYDLRPGVGAADAFPWARWRRVVGWLDAGGHLAGGAQAGSGETSALVTGRWRWESLLGPAQAREAIAGWLRRSRALRCAPEQLLIAAGIQQVLALLARLLVEPADGVLVENPGYMGLHAAFLAEGARLVGAPVDARGLRVEELPRGMDAGPRLAVVTPSHQYPTGVTLPLDRRLALLQWAREAGATVVEDDYDGELRLEGQPLEALQGLDTRGGVVYLGTFAKALYPAVRLAFAVLPDWLVEPAARARAVSDRHPTWHDAMQVARFIEAGELERHLARVRRLYRARRDALVAALRAELGELAALGPAEAGIHLRLDLPAGVDDVGLAERAREAGVGVAALSPYYLSDARPGLLLGFGAMPEERLVEGARRLAPLVRAACAAAAEGLVGDSVLYSGQR
jgi:GntR family transcriptional regulator/MocR family aminotransferase